MYCMYLYQIKKPSIIFHLSLSISERNDGHDFDPRTIKSNEN